MLAGLPPTAAILELGCGPGYFLEYLRKRGFSNAQGIDVSPEQVNLACQKGLPAKLGDVFDTLGDHEQAFDAIICIDLLEHFSKDEGLRLVDAIHRNLRPGGRVLFQTPNGSALLGGPIIYGDLTHLAIYNQSSLGQLLAASGFDRNTFAETGPVLKNGIGILRCVVWSVTKLMANLIRIAESGGSQKVWTQNILCRAFRPTFDRSEQQAA